MCVLCCVCVCGGGGGGGGGGGREGVGRTLVSKEAIVSLWFCILALGCARLQLL